MFQKLIEKSIKKMTGKKDYPPYEIYYLPCCLALNLTIKEYIYADKLNWKPFNNLISMFEIMMKPARINLRPTPNDDHTWFGRWNKENLPKRIAIFKDFEIRCLEQELYKNW